MDTQTPHAPWTDTPPAAPAPAATDTADSVASAVGEKAGAIWDDAKQTANETLTQKKGAAADSIDNVAGALRDAGQRSGAKGGSDTLAGLTGSAADGLERLSGALRNKDVATMVRDVESFAREQPLAFFGLAVAVGFLGVRFLKASNT